MSSLSSGIDHLLAVCENPDALFPLSEAPRIVQELTGGQRPHLSAIQRWARVGLSGIRLRVVKSGRNLLTTRRWLLQLWGEAAEAARRDEIANPRPKPSRPARTAELSDEEREVLQRHGLTE